MFKHPFWNAQHLLIERSRFEHENNLIHFSPHELISELWICQKMLWEKDSHVSRIFVTTPSNVAFFSIPRDSEWVFLFFFSPHSHYFRDDFPLSFLLLPSNNHLRKWYWYCEREWEWWKQLGRLTNIFLSLSSVFRFYSPSRPVKNNRKMFS